MPGVQGIVYQVNLGGHIVACKVGKESKVGISQELCLQRISNRHGLSPDVLASWKCDNQDVYVIMMEQVDGFTFGSFIRGDGQQLADVLIEVIYSALVLNLEAHVLHKDLHAGNVMLTENGRVQIVDFGMSIDYPMDTLAQCLNNNPTDLPTHGSFSAIVGVTSVMLVVYDIHKLISDVYARLYSSKNSKQQKFGQLLQERDIISSFGIFNVYSRLYQQHKRIPTPHELIESFSRIIRES